MSQSLTFPDFPARPLCLARKRSVMGPLLGWLLLVIFFAALSFLNWKFYLGGLIAEAPLRDTGAVTRDVALTEGRCKTEKAIFTICSGQLRYRTLPEHGGQVMTQRLVYALIGEVDDQAEFSVKYDPAHPELHSTSWGLHHYANRLVMAGLLAFFLVAMLLLCGVRAFAPWRSVGRLKAALQSPRVAVVRLSALTQTGRRVHGQVHFQQRGKSRKAKLDLRADEQPLMLGDTDFALALLEADGRPFVLDATLADLELSSLEREQVQRAAGSWRAAAV